jgi:hypothetical protein
MGVSLKDWIINNRIIGSCVDRILIKAKANKIYSEIHPFSLQLEHITCAVLKDFKHL